MSSAPPTVPHYYGRTPAGGKVHIVFGAPSMLALGKRGKSDYASLCGVVPEEWEETDDPEEGTVCQRCDEHSVGVGDE